MVLDPDIVVPKLRQWAETNRYIDKLWLYGSCARGEAKAESDLDIAVQITVPPEREGFEDADAVYLDERENWQRELRNLLKHTDIQLEQLDPDGTPTIKAGLSEGNTLVYCRNHC